MRSVPIRRVLVLLNQGAGKLSAPDLEPHQEVRNALASVGITAELVEVPGPELSSRAAEALQDHATDAVVAAGGDGTVGAVASALAGTSKPMGVLPVGTLNHFAKDLSIPVDLRAAAAVIASGQMRQVDVGRVNHHVFINNSSIGLYPQVVRHREQIRQRLGRGKWYAMLLATAAIFQRFPLVRVRLVTKGQSWLRTTPFVFVGNNHYHLDLFNLGQRSRLDRGQLSVYFTHRAGRLGMLRLALRAVLGMLRQDKDFCAIHAADAWIDSVSKELAVSVDGEVRHLAPPLHYRIWPGALHVLAPE